MLNMNNLAFGMSLLNAVALIITGILWHFECKKNEKLKSDIWIANQQTIGVEKMRDAFGDELDRVRSENQAHIADRRDLVDELENLEIALKLMRKNLDKAELTLFWSNKANKILKADIAEIWEDYCNTGFLRDKREDYNNYKVSLDGTS